MASTGISGQAVLEGVLMRSKNKYALAVRKPNDDIEVLVEKFNSISDKNNFFNLPFIRGIAQFFEGLYLGIKNFSVIGKSYTVDDDRDSEGKSELLQLLIVIAIISIAIGTFIVLPYGLSLFFRKIITSGITLAMIEGIVRVILLVLYLFGISMLPDVKRLYMYLGASHKVMKCMHKKIPLTTSNVKRMSRKANNCDTVFLFTVVILSVLLFMFVNSENLILRIAIRLLIIPIVAALVYEARELSAKMNNPLVKLLNIPTVLVQTIISDEPDDEMIEVAIKSASAVVGEDSELEETIKMPEKSEKKKKGEATKGIKRVNKQKQTEIKSKVKNKETEDTKQVKSKELSERAKLAVYNKEDRKPSAAKVTEEEDDEI